jgi:hypothetical protein
MFTIFVHAPLLLMPIVNLPNPTSGCLLEILMPVAIEERAVGEFDAAVNHYITLHRRLERSLPPEEMFDDPEDMYAAVEALHEALVDARPNVRAGNIFGRGISDLIKTRLDEAILAQGYEVADILRSLKDERLPGTPEPRINDTFAGGIGAPMWPSLLAVLPPLPRELEYRFVERRLVLIDVHADLVVDILEDALPDR